MSDETPSSKAPPWSEFATILVEVRDQVDRIAGLSAQAVMLAERNTRLVASGHRLDEREAAKVRSLLMDVRDTMAALSTARVSAPAADAGGAALVPIQSPDDRITASFKLEYQGKDKKASTVKAVLIAIGKAAATAAVGALLHWLASR